MIVVKVELWSAQSGDVTELARMQICNVGGTETRGNYDGATLRGRSAEALQAAMRRRTFTKEATVENYDRQGRHVWNLVALMLAKMGYGK